VRRVLPQGRLTGPKTKKRICTAVQAERNSLCRFSFGKYAPKSAANF
jgi:hypothetical protein